MSLNPESFVVPEQNGQAQQIQEANERLQFAGTLQEIKHRIGRAAAAGLLVLGAGVAGFAGEEIVHPTPATAASLGYPWKDAPCKFADGGVSCKDPSNPTDQNNWYDWGVYDDSGNFHQYRSGYEYRNCTDYVQWKIGTYGVSVPSGLGNGGQWYTNAPTAEKSSTPKPGEAAVVPGTVGHVAFVESVNTVDPSNPGNDNITVSEYNHDAQGNGDTRTGKASDMGFTEYVDFGVDPAKVTGGSGGAGSTSAPNLSIIQHQNTNSGMTEFRQVSAASEYGAWIGGWATPDGTHAGTDVDYGMADQNGDGTPDLYKIQHANTGSGHVEVQVMNGANNNRSWIGGWTTPEGVHSGNDVHYVVADYNRDGKPDVIEVQDWNTASGHIEIKVMDGHNNNQSWIGGWATPEGWHGAADVDFVASSCGTTGAPNIYEILHANTASGHVEVKEFNGGSNYTSYVGGWTTSEGLHSGDDVNYTAAGCNSNGKPNIYEIQHQNTNSGMTEVKELDGSTNYASYAGVWTTPDGQHSGNDVDYVMPQ